MSDQDEVALPSRPTLHTPGNSRQPGNPNGNNRPPASPADNRAAPPPAGAPQYRAAPTQSTQQHEPVQSHQPSQQQQRPPVQQHAAQPQYSNTPRISPQDATAIPHTSNPVEMDVLLGQLNLSMTIGEGDVIDGGTITIGEGKSMVVKGMVRSDIVCHGVLIITKTGTVQGSIQAGQCWIEGEVTSSAGEESLIDAGVLHLGVGSKINANCVYDQLSISSPNRGVSGRMNSRNSIPSRNG